MPYLLLSVKDLSVYLVMDMRLYLIPCWAVHIGKLLGKIIGGKKFYAFLSIIRADDYCKKFIFVNNPFNSLSHIISPLSFVFKQPFPQGQIMYFFSAGRVPCFPF